MRNYLTRFVLKRKLFKGQFRLLLWFYNHKYLKEIQTIVSPIIGDFKINVDTKNLIDACIYYMGDYEAYLKIHFRQLIKKNDTVLDVGANIGFHTLYFAELVGAKGKVIAFEPVAMNFEALKKNIELNNFPQIETVEKALGNENTFMNIHIDETAKNPGSFNLMAKGIKNTKIDCTKGDDYLLANNIPKIDFIKVDVEGFELEVFKGLEKTISQHNPIIIFEYDQSYQSKLNKNPQAIFNFLAKFPYQFFKIDGYGNRTVLMLNDDLQSSEILALPANKSN